MSEEPQQKDTFGALSRWIDKYALRYTAGTIVGAVIVAYLHMRIAGITTKDMFTAEMLTAYVALGFAWCYIASSPILVIHSVRSLVFPLSEPAKRLNRTLTTLLVVTFVLGLFLLGKVFGMYWPRAVGISGFAMSWIGLMACVVLVGRNRQTVYAWQKELVARRATAPKGLVESYRDLREHGNAFFVVVLEIQLGILVYSIGTEDQFFVSGKYDKPAMIGAALFLWTLPGALVYLNGQRMEADFQADSENGVAKPKPPPPPTLLGGAAKQLWRALLLVVIALHVCKVIQLDWVGAALLLVALLPELVTFIEYIKISRDGFEAKSRQGTTVVEPVAGVGAELSEFGKLTEPEKDILATLWHYQKGYGEAKEQRWGFAAGKSSANFDRFTVGRLLLMQRGYIWSDERKLVYLSNSGLDLCEKNHAEVEARPIAYANFVAA